MKPWQLSCDKDLYQIIFSDGSSLTFSQTNISESAELFQEISASKSWPQVVDGVLLLNGFEGGLFDLIYFMTKKGMRAYNSSPEFMKWTQINPYIHGAIAALIQAGKFYSLAEVAQPLWTGSLSPKQAFEKVKAA